MIYVASPYTHPDPAVRQRRFEDVCTYAAEYAAGRDCLLADHALTSDHRALPPTGHLEYWAHFDRSMIQRADALEVLMLDGWCRSVGVNAEIDFARGLELPISFHEFVRRKAA